MIISMIPIVRKTLMQDESTLYDVYLSGARSLSEVNAFLTKRDPYFVELSQNEFDTIIANWLFKCLINERKKHFDIVQYPNKII